MLASVVDFLNSRVKLGEQQHIKWQRVLSYKFRKIP